MAEAAYASPSLQTRNAALLAKRAGINIGDAKKYLENSASWQIGRANPEKTPELYAPTGGSVGLYICDIMYLQDYAGVNQKRKMIFILIGANTRYVYLRGMTAATALKASECLRDIYVQNQSECATHENRQILTIRSDMGSEFKGEFHSTLEELGIIHKYVPGWTHWSLRRLDRFCRTIRGILGDLFNQTGRNVWYPHLQDIALNYNTRPHSSLKKALGFACSPAEVDRTREEQIRDYDKNRALTVRKLVDDSPIKAGSKVRLLMSATQAGSKKIGVKSHLPRWTKRIYTVLARAGANSFRIDQPGLESEIFPVHALLLVPDSMNELPPDKSVNTKVVAAQRVEARARSQAEQKAAVMVPKERRRARRVARVDYTGML
jgi:hypothetical protein